MTKTFEIHSRDISCRARTGTLHLPHGSVDTPAFMPVGTNGTVKALAEEDIDEIGFDIILANTYHLFLRPGPATIGRAGGLHGFMNRRKNILTDSGGFQIFSLSAFRKISEEGVRFRSHLDGSSHFFTPESVVEIQRTYNSDIQMQLDVCSPYGTPYKKALGALLVTNNWMHRAKKRCDELHAEGYQGLFFPIVQGNFHKDLRKMSAEETTAIDSQGIAIGGLSVGEPFELFAEYLAYTAELLPREKPLYVMGIGTPQYMLQAIEHGVDIFDCVLPTRLARHGVAMTSCGQVSIKKERYADDFTPLDGRCSCKVCKNHSRAYLRHLFRAGEMLSAMLLSYHNLHFLYHLVKGARRAIEEGKFLDFKRNCLSGWD